MKLPSASFSAVTKSMWNSPNRNLRSARRSAGKWRLLAVIRNSPVDMDSYPVVGIKATLLDGSYHPVDSSEMAFKMAATLAFKKGFMDANPVLLEPIASVKVVVPDKFTGDVMGDLNRRRGRVLGMNSLHGGKQEIVADVPMSEMFGYNTDLRSMTGGIGVFSYEFSRYEQAPGDVQKKEVEARTAGGEVEA